MKQVLVVDSSSLMNFFRYYYFDRNYGAKVYDKLVDFIVDKVLSGEIVVIDKVNDELFVNGDNKDFKKRIAKMVPATFMQNADVLLLREKYYLADNEREYGDNAVLIAAEIDKYENKYADLFLVAYCNKLITDGMTPVLITEETVSKDKKLVAKIPIICRGEKIECKNLPHTLFDIYKDELKFSLQ